MKFGQVFLFLQLRDLISYCSYDSKHTGRRWEMKLQFQEQLKSLRSEKNLSIEELSLRTQVSTEKLTAYENGEQIPSTQTILILSTVLEVPVSNLIDGLH